MLGTVHALVNCVPARRRPLIEVEEMFNWIFASTPRADGDDAGAAAHMADTRRGPS